MKNYPLFLLAILLIGLTSCSKNRGGDPTDCVYYNSFENDSDLEIFEGYAAQISDDVADDAGEQSLLVSGGCIAPHFYGEIGPFDQDYTVQLQILGKSLDGLGGNISMYLPSDSQQRLDILVDDTAWKEYSTGTLFIPAGEPVMISFLSGGIAEVTTFFDEIKLISK